jgi:hypothetical protein
MGAPAPRSFWRHRAPMRELIALAIAERLLASDH